MDFWIGFTIGSMFGAGLGILVMCLAAVAFETVVYDALEANGYTIEEDE